MQKSHSKGIPANSDIRSAQRGVAQKQARADYLLVAPK